MLDLRDQILVRPLYSASGYLITPSQATPKDIESLVQSGSESHTCPYFGSRRAIPQAQASNIQSTIFAF